MVFKFWKRISGNVEESFVEYWGSLEAFEETFESKFVLIKFKEISGKVSIFPALADYNMYFRMLQNWHSYQNCHKPVGADDIVSSVLQFNLLWVKLMFRDWTCVVGLKLYRVDANFRQFHYQTYRHAKLVIKDCTCGPALSCSSPVFKFIYYFVSHSSLALKYYFMSRSSWS